MRTLIVALCLLASAEVQAACVRVACYEVSGVVESCRELRRDGQMYLHLRIPQADAKQVECADPPAQPSTPGEIEVSIAGIRRQSDFFVEGSGPACSGRVGAVFTGALDGPCCDTVPAAGACTLGGPLLIERRTGSSTPGN